MSGSSLRGSVSLPLPTLLEKSVDTSAFIEPPSTIMSKNDTLIVYSLPVSGGSFAAQLGLLSELYEARKKQYNGKFKSHKDYAPDLIFSASGGNVAAYSGFAGDWSYEGIIRVCKDFTSEMFVRSWFPPMMNFLPTALIGIFTGSLYRPGYGAKYLFERCFNLQTIQEIEIWTGTYNRTTNQAEFFCNRSQERALIQEIFFDADADKYAVMPLRYMSDEPNVLENLAKISMASASIPYVVEEQKIGQHSYSDGGVMYASPTSAFCNEIFRLVKGHIFDNVLCMSNDGTMSNEKEILKPRRLRHFYFSPYDINSPEVTQSCKTVNTAITQILYTNLLSDRAAAVLNLQHIYGIEGTQLIHEHYTDITEDQLSEILMNMEKYDHYVCDLYPIGIPAVNIQNFTIKELISVINKTRLHYGIQIWYYDPVLSSNFTPS